MAQAVKPVSLTDDDCNDADPGQEHFDATLDACGAAVVALINAAPRTPTAEEITDLIRSVLREGFDSEQAEAVDATLFGNGVRVGYSDDPADPTNFKAVADAEFSDSNEEFCENYLVTTRVAFRLLQSDRPKAVDIVGRMMADGNERLVDTLADNMEITAEKFAAIAGLVKTAMARFEIARRFAKEGRQ
jgi:hypothetical protein